MDDFIETNRIIISGETVDLSPSGALNHCKEPLELGEVFELAIRVPIRYAPMRSIAEVIQLQTCGSDEEHDPNNIGVKSILISSFVSSYLKSRDTHCQEEEPEE